MPKDITQLQISRPWFSSVPSGKAYNVSIMLKPRGDYLDNFNNFNSTRLDLLPCLNTKGRPDQATINSKET